MNPRSGGGKVVRFGLREKAESLGAEVAVLEGPGTVDVAGLARDAVARGADLLGVAGGDGTQALVAAVAAEHDVPLLVISAGTRNHFALDLGVDRDDVVGALDALVDGGERIVDLAEVNGRVFVNNVSLGVYAEAVQKSGYRDAKLRTLLDTVPDTIGPQGEGVGLHFADADGHEAQAGAVVLVSNNRYRLGKAIGSGTRPRLDEGVLGVAMLDAPTATHRPWHDWTAPNFDVAADTEVAAGIDGEAVRLVPPLHFVVRPHALRVRIARSHPGASPSARQPESAWAAARALARIAAGS